MIFEKNSEITKKGPIKGYCFHPILPILFTGNQYSISSSSIHFSASYINFPKTNWKIKTLLHHPHIPLLAVIQYGAVVSLYNSETGKLINQISLSDTSILNILNADQADNVLYAIFSNVGSKLLYVLESNPKIVHMIEIAPFYKAGQLMEANQSALVPTESSVQIGKKTKLFSQSKPGFTEIKVNHSILSIACHPKAPIFAVGCFDGLVRIYHFTSYSLIGVLDEFSLHIGKKKLGRSPVSSLSFSPDQKLIFSGTTDGYILIWNLQNYATPRLVAKRLLISEKIRKLAWNASKIIAPYLKAKLTEPGEKSNEQANLAVQMVSATTAKSNTVSAHWISYIASLILSLSCATSTKPYRRAKQDQATLSTCCHSIMGSFDQDLLEDLFQPAEAVVDIFFARNLFFCSTSGGNLFSFPRLNVFETLETQLCPTEFDIQCVRLFPSSYHVSCLASAPYNFSIDPSVVLKPFNLSKLVLDLYDKERPPASLFSRYTFLPRLCAHPQSGLFYLAIDWTWSRNLSKFCAKQTKWSLKALTTAGKKILSDDDFIDLMIPEWLCTKQFIVNLLNTENPLQSENNLKSTIFASHTGNRLLFHPHASRMISSWGISSQPPSKLLQPSPQSTPLYHFHLNEVYFLDNQTLVAHHVVFGDTSASMRIKPQEIFQFPSLLPIPETDYFQLAVKKSDNELRKRALPDVSNKFKRFHIADSSQPAIPFRIIRHDPSKIFCVFFQTESMNDRFESSKDDFTHNLFRFTLIHESGQNDLVQYFLGRDAAFVSDSEILVLSQDGLSASLSNSHRFLIGEQPIIHTYSFAAHVPPDQTLQIFRIFPCQGLLYRSFSDDIPSSEATGVATESNRIPVIYYNIASNCLLYSKNFVKPNSKKPYHIDFRGPRFNLFQGELILDLIWQPQSTVGHRFWSKTFRKNDPCLPVPISNRPLIAILTSQRVILCNDLFQTLVSLSVPEPFSFKNCFWVGESIIVCSKRSVLFVTQSGYSGLIYTISPSTVVISILPDRMLCWDPVQGLHTIPISLFEPLFLGIVDSLVPTSFSPSKVVPPRSQPIWLRMYLSWTLQSFFKHYSPQKLSFHFLQQLQQNGLPDAAFALSLFCSKFRLNEQIYSALVSFEYEKIAPLILWHHLRKIPNMDSLLDVLEDIIYSGGDEGSDASDLSDASDVSDEDIPKQKDPLSIDTIVAQSRQFPSSSLPKFSKGNPLPLWYPKLAQQFSVVGSSLFLDEIADTKSIKKQSLQQLPPKIITLCNYIANILYDFGQFGYAQLLYMISKNYVQLYRLATLSSHTKFLHILALHLEWESKLVQSSQTPSESDEYHQQSQHDEHDQHTWLQMAIFHRLDFQIPPPFLTLSVRLKKILDSIKNLIKSGNKSRVTLTWSELEKIFQTTFDATQLCLAISRSSIKTIDPSTYIAFVHMLEITPPAPSSAASSVSFGNLGSGAAYLDSLIRSTTMECITNCILHAPIDSLENLASNLEFPLALFSYYILLYENSFCKSLFGPVIATVLQNSEKIYFANATKIQVLRKLQNNFLQAMLLVVSTILKGWQRFPPSIVRLFQLLSWKFCEYEKSLATDEEEDGNNPKIDIISLLGSIASEYILEPIFLRPHLVDSRLSPKNPTQTAILKDITTVLRTLFSLETFDDTHLEYQFVNRFISKNHKHISKFIQKIEGMSIETIAEAARLLALTVAKSQRDASGLIHILQGAGVSNDVSNNNVIMSIALHVSWYLFQHRPVLTLGEKKKMRKKVASWLLINFDLIFFDPLSISDIDTLEKRMLIDKSFVSSGANQALPHSMGTLSTHQANGTLTANFDPNPSTILITNTTLHSPFGLGCSKISDPLSQPWKINWYSYFAPDFEIPPVPTILVSTPEQTLNYIEQKLGSYFEQQKLNDTPDVKRKVTIPPDVGDLVLALHQTLPPILLEETPPGCAILAPLSDEFEIDYANRHIQSGVYPTLNILANKLTETVSTAASPRQATLTDMEQFTNAVKRPQMDNLFDVPDIETIENSDADTPEEDTNDTGGSDLFESAMNAMDEWSDDDEEEDDGFGSFKPTSFEIDMSATKKNVENSTKLPPPKLSLFSGVQGIGAALPKTPRGFGSTSNQTNLLKLSLQNTGALSNPSEIQNSLVKIRKSYNESIVESLSGHFVDSLAKMNSVISQSVQFCLNLQNQIDQEAKENSITQKPSTPRSISTEGSVTTRKKSIASKTLSLSNFLVLLQNAVQHKMAFHILIAGDKISKKIESLKENHKKLLASLSSEPNQNDQVSSSRNDILSRSIKLAFLYRLVSLLQLDVQLKNPLYKLAINKNMVVGNFGIAGNLLKLVGEIVELTPKQKHQFFTCRQHQFQNGSLPPYSCPSCKSSTSSGQDQCSNCLSKLHICFKSILPISTTQLSLCSLCKAEFSPQLVAPPGSQWKTSHHRCTYCGSESLELISLLDNQSSDDDQSDTGNEDSDNDSTVPQASDSSTLTSGFGENPFL